MFDLVADVITRDGSRLIFERRIKSGGLPLDDIITAVQPASIHMDLVEVRGRRVRLSGRERLGCSAVEAVVQFDEWRLLAHT